MNSIVEYHRVPLNSRITLLYQRQASRQMPLQVDCSFRLGYGESEPGHIYALMKAFQSQFSPAWRPILALTPDWSQLSFRASPEYRRDLDQQWQQLFELESALIDLEPLKQGLFQEQHLLQSSPNQQIHHGFLQFAFAGTAYGRPPLGVPNDLKSLDQEALLDLYMNLFAHSQVIIRIRDHQPLHHVIDRLRPLIDRAETEIYRPEKWNPILSGPREQAVTMAVEGLYLNLGFVLAGMDQAGWIYGPLLQAWLQEIWASHPPHRDLHLLGMEWVPWQRASLLCLRMHSHQAHAAQSFKSALVNWLIEARQSFLTSRRLRQAIQKASRHWHEETPPFFCQIEESLEGWGAGRQRLLQVNLNAFQQAIRKYLNADHWVLQALCREPELIQPDYDPHKTMVSLGFAPPAAPQTIASYHEFQRLHIDSGLPIWIYPQAHQKQLEIGIYFDSGAAQERIPGTGHLLLQYLAQRFEELSQAQDERGVTRQANSWQIKITQDYCFFKWACPPAELTQALQILEQLLGDLPSTSLPIDQLKQSHQGYLQNLQLDPLWKASTQFALSGFANHPYALNSEGTYTSLQQIHEQDLRHRWQELRQTGLVKVVFAGYVPQSLNAEALESVFKDLRISSGNTSKSTPVRTRRGEIQVQAEPQRYRLEGHIFDQPLALSEQALLNMSIMWMQDQLRRLYGIPIVIQSQCLRSAWYFQIAGLYEKTDRQAWIQELHHLDESLELIKQRHIADWRAAQFKSSQFWPLLMHHLAFEGSPGSFMEYELHVLSVHTESLEAFMLKMLSRQNDWLQIVFQGLPEKHKLTRFEHSLI